MHFSKTGDRVKLLFIQQDNALGESVIITFKLKKGNTLRILTTLFLIFNFIIISTYSNANTGVFFGSGNQVIPIKNDKIQLVREKVDFKLNVDENSGRYGVPFIPWVNVTAKFFLKNISQDSVSLQMGFPFLDLQGFGDEKYVLENLNFKVLSNGTEIQSEIKEGLIEKEFDPDGYFKKVFAWQDNFNPKEEKEVVVTYKMLMGVGSANSISRDFDEQGQKFSAIDDLFPALSYSFGYITKTAYTWAGRVEEAIFQLDCSAFYQELEKHNFILGLEKKGYSFTRPIFWESLYPESATKTKEVYTWSFARGVPEEGLSINFIVLYLPSIPSEVNSYYKTSLSQLEKIKSEELKAVINGYYQNIVSGTNPSDPFAKNYFEKVNLIKMPKNIIFAKDKKNLSEISRKFENYIKN